MHICLSNWVVFNPNSHIYIDIHKLCVLFSLLLGITNTISHLLIYIYMYKIYTYSRMKISINIDILILESYRYIENYICGYFDKNINELKIVQNS